MLPHSDSLLVSLALAAVLLTVIRIYRLPRAASVALGLVWVAAILALDVFGLEAHRIASAAPSAERPLSERTDGYVSSQACQACHPSEHASWNDSYHSSMTTEPSVDTVLAPFRGEVLSYGYDYTPHRRGDEFWISTNNPEWAEPGETLPVARRVGLVTGSHHQQLFWFERPGTRAVGRFHFFYRLAEQRWVPFNSAVLMETTPLMHLGESWTTTCVRCHSTHAKPRFNSPEVGKMDTRVAELGIACEACHGPGLEHVEANRNTLRRYVRHWFGGADETIVNPPRLSADRSVDVCGQCHAVQSFGSHARLEQWSRNGMPYLPGDDLSKDRYVVKARSGSPDEVSRERLRRSDPTFFEDRFWPDGVANVSGREYHGVKDSPCYASGEFTCLSCHQLHQQGDDSRSSEEWADDQVAVDKQDNRACVGCHPQFTEPAALEAHSHHAAESTGSRCYNCHMANTSYGLLKGTRSHFIESPDTATQLATGRPNACNLCHLDRTLAWTADTLEQWYGTAPPEFVDPEHRRTAEGALQILRGDAGQRALAAFHFGWEPARRAASIDDWGAPLLAQLSLDPYEAVRFLALQSLAKLPGYAELDVDHLAAPRLRRQAQERLLDGWPGPRSGFADPERLARVLIDERGDRMRARVAQLLEQRDNRRVFRGE